MFDGNIEVFREIKDSKQAEYKCFATLYEYIGHTDDTLRHFEFNSTNGGNSCYLIAVGCGNSSYLTAVGCGNSSYLIAVGCGNSSYLIAVGCCNSC